MRILHVITTLDRGGAENQLLTLVSEQVKLHNIVEVIYLKGNSELKSEFESIGSIFPLDISNLSPLAQLFELRRYLADYVGIVHAHLPRAELVSRLAIDSQPFFVSRHYGERFWPKMPVIFSNYVSKFVLRKCKVVIAISNYVEEYLKLSGELNENDSVFVIPYALNRNSLFENSVSLSNEYLNLVKDKFVIGTVSRLSPEKDLRTFILAIKELSNLSSNFIGVIIGGGPLENELKTFAKQQNLVNQVIFVGRTANVPGYLKTFDVFLLTSLFEGFGLVLLESMAVGMPVIGTKTGSIPEVVGKDGPGILVEVGDYESIAKEILTLSLDPDLISYLSQKGVIRSKKFDPKIMAEKIQSLYSEFN
jgi:glycosyltransferase involved in cell wall biosynthesis